MEKIMGYTTSQIHRNRERIVIDVRSWSFTVWLKRRLWQRPQVVKRWWFIVGPFELAHHALD
jgi:hypothetical protein